jgi:hypothetical protein
VLLEPGEQLAAELIGGGGGRVAAQLHVDRVIVSQINSDRSSQRLSSCLPSEREVRNVSIAASIS